MYMLSAEKQRIQLAPLETHVSRSLASRGLAVRAAVDREADPVDAAALVARACRAFFDIGRRAGIADEAPAPEGPPPVAFREEATGLLHVIYREVVVRFKPGTSKKARAAILAKYELRVRQTNPFVPDQVIVYQPDRKYSGEKLLEVANSMAETEEVVFAAPNFVTQYRRHAPPSVLGEEWHLRNQGGGGALAGEDVDIATAWGHTTGKKDIVIAVLDDGVDVEHPNLKSRIWRNPDATAPNQMGRDFFLADDHPDHFNPRPKLFRSPFDQMAGNDIHGTPCAGVIAAAGKSAGSVGAAPGCRILPVKVFHADDLADSGRVANAIRFAAGIADIISCSWSGGFSADVQLALADAGQIGRNGKGSAIFCAAGNGSGQPVAFPASDTNAIAVGASTDQATIASYSNVGAEIAICAPSSGGIRGIFTTDLSTRERGFNLGRADRGGIDGLHTHNFGGTSSATPLAAGVAALVLSVNPDLTRTELRDLLTSTTDKIGTGYDANGHSQQFGFGRINAGRAVTTAVGQRAGAPAGTTAAPAGVRVAKRRAKAARKAGRKTTAKTVTRKVTRKAAVRNAVAKRATARTSPARKAAAGKASRRRAATAGAVVVATTSRK